MKFIRAANTACVRKKVLRRFVHSDGQICKSMSIQAKRKEFPENHKLLISALTAQMAQNLNNKLVGRIELLRALNAATYFPGASDSIRLLKIRDAELTTLLKNIGIKAKTRWEATTDQVLAVLLAGVTTLDSEASEFIVGIRVGQSLPLVEISTKEDPESVKQELTFRLKSVLVNDRAAKREADKFERRRDDERRALALQRRELGIARITPQVDSLRREILELARLFSIDTWVLRGIRSLKHELEALQGLSEKLSFSSWKARSGRIDSIVEQVLRDFDLFSIYDAPHLLSAVGYFIDSDVCLAVLQVRNDYKAYTQQTGRGTLDYQLWAGYRPHTEVIKELPRCLYDHPGYIAPVDDLLNWLAIDFYAGQVAGPAEDGAVGWLLHSTSKHLNDPPNLLQRLAEESPYWTVERLTQCLSVWNDIVGPVLLSKRA